MLLHRPYRREDCQKYVALPERERRKKEKRPAYSRKYVCIKNVLEDRGTEVGDTGQIKMRIENSKPVN
jgi:hypothetical protein